VPAVDHDGQLDRPGPAEVADGVQRGPDSPTGKQHVVDQHHDAAVQVGGKLGGCLGNDRPKADVVAVEGHVQGAERRSDPLDFLEGFD